MSIYTPYQTSAELLVKFAEAKWGPQSGTADEEASRRYLMIYDLYIKARSYSLINKIAFFIAIISGMAVLAWPSIAVVFKDFGVNKEFVQSAIVQTSVTGFAALTFGVYSHYKKQQMYVENLMRHVVFSNQPAQALLDMVLKEVSRIDAGFSFSEELTKKATHGDEHA